MPKNYTVDQKWSAYARYLKLRLQGVLSTQAHRQAAAASGASLASVYRWIADAEKYDVLTRKPVSGRPKKLTEEQEIALLNEAVEHPELPYGELAARLNLDICRQTVDRYLRHYRLRRRIAMNKAYYTEDQLIDRLDLAFTHRNDTVMQWAYRVVLDEVGFVMCHTGRVWTTRVDGEGILPAHTNRTIYRYSNPLRFCVVMVPYYNYIRFYPITQHFTGEYFMTILDQVRLGLDALFVDGRDYEIIMDSHQVHKWCQNRKPAAWTRMNFFHWPAKCQDLSILENWFGALKTEMNKRKLLEPGGRIWTNDRLRTMITETVTDITASPNLIQKLVITMPKRMQMVIDVGGHAINY
jgi:hypothetical protein